jgi:hypothetical protein
MEKMLKRVDIGHGSCEELVWPAIRYELEGENNAT